jgi:hypothetical protein
MYKSTINLGNIPKTVVVINYKTEQEMTEQVSVDCLHHIQILDRSHSMSGNIDELIENVKQTINFISDNDYVSIIWFGSEGQYKTLIRGAKKDVGLFPLLDSIKSTVGCTCFSDSFTEVGEIINDLQTICPNFSITLFTDGQAVVPWGEEEEEKRVFSAIDSWKDKVVAINTVGYGNHYNEKFLKDISAKSEFGQMIHSSTIGDYSDIFSHNYERITELCLDYVEVSAPTTEILYLNSKTSKMTQDTLTLKMLEKKKNQFILVLDSSTEKFTLNGVEYDLTSITSKIPKDTLNTITYAYAYENYYKGNRKYALDILVNNLQDKKLVDEQFKAFTFDECADYMKLFKKAVFSTKGRLLEGSCDENYIPKDNATCIMDILKTLVEGDNYYIYTKNYKRTGLQVTDKFNLFKKLDEPTTTPIKELVFNKERLNISVRSKILGKVTLNPIQANKVGLPKEIDSCEFRTQTIISDGNLNIEKIKVILDKKTLTTLQDLNIPNLLEDIEQLRLLERYIVTLNLKTLPVINRSYLTESSLIGNVLSHTLKITQLEANQKVANYFLKIMEGRVDYDSTYVSKQYTPEQFDVLKEHGLDSSLRYVGIDNEKAQKKEDDFYETRELTFTLKGYSSLPSVPDVIKKVKEGGKLNGPATLMKDYLMDLQQRINQGLTTEEKPISILDDLIVFPNELEFFREEIKTIAKELLNLRIDMCSMKIAKVLTGDWFEDLISDGKGNYQYVNEGNTLIVKTDKVKVYF